MKEERRTMRCRKARLTIDAYVSGELGPRDRVAIEEHLKACDGCRQAATVSRRLVALGQALPMPPVPEGFAQRLQVLARQRIARPMLAVPSWSLAAWWRMASAPVRAAAAAVLVVGLASGVLMGWSTWQTPAAPPTQAVSQADPLASYNVDYLTDAPDGSLAQTYLTLVSSPAQEGK
jgi:anti-sigma factor RsiW